MRVFSRTDAEEILKPCGVGKYLEYTDDGIWPAVQRDLNMVAETELLRWRPARELQERPDAPKVTDTPMLPFPFTANDLAAFMLNGIGALIGEFYGDWSEQAEPDPQMLQHIDPDSEGRRALIDAYAAYQAAKLLVPAGPDGQPDVGAMVGHFLKNQSNTRTSTPTLTPQQRQNERWEACVKAGLKMPTDTYAQYPRGIGKVAIDLGITRQSLKEDLDKHRERMTRQ